MRQIRDERDRALEDSKSELARLKTASDQARRDRHRRDVELEQRGAARGGRLCWRLVLRRLVVQRAHAGLQAVEHLDVGVELGLLGLRPLASPEQYPPDADDAQLDPHAQRFTAR